MNSVKKKRLHIIDEYRGLVVLNMIAYHGIWDLVYMFGNDWQWYKSDIGRIWQQWICWSFILVSGFCWQMGKRPIKRGLEIYIAGMLVSIVTLIVTPESRVIFGVLTLLGSSMILMVPFDLLFQKLSPIAGAIGSFFLFVFTYSVNRGYLGFGEQTLIVLPKEWYANLFTTYWGFTEGGFFSTDYFSIIPWFFLYVTGYFLYSIGQTHKGSFIMSAFEKSVCPPLGWIGRNALLIYILHQPVLYGVLTIIYDFGV